MKCLYCNDTGRTVKDPFKCEKCGKEWERGSLDMIQYNGYIPKKYTETGYWNDVIIRNDLKKKTKDKDKYDSISKWINILDNLLKSLKVGTLPPESFYIAGPRDRAKYRWAYTSLALAEANGFSTFELVDLSDTNEKLSEVQYCDWLVIRVTDYKIKENIEKLNYLLPLRSSKDLGTVLISTIPYQAMLSKAEVADLDVDNIIENFM